jgi:citrate synthase
MAAPTKSPSTSRAATASADEAEADIVRRVQNKEIVIGFGHPVYTIADPRNQVIKDVAQRLSKEGRTRSSSTSPTASRP